MTCYRMPRAGPGKAVVVSGVSRLAQQLRQLGDVHGDAPRFIAGEQLRRRAPTGLLLEIDVGERLPVVIADDVAGVGLLGGPGRREVARLACELAVLNRFCPKNSMSSS